MNSKQQAAERLRKIRRVRKTLGNSLTEYVFVLFIVSIVGVALLKSIGSRTNKLLESTNTNMP
jgi:hypothetical protein